MRPAASPALDARGETGWLRAGRGRPAAALVALLFGLLMVLRDFAPERAVRNLLFDTYQQVFPRDPGGDYRVVVVGIDDRSLSLLGQWPWRRNIMAALIERVAAAGPAAIGMDLIFAESDRYSPRYLAEQLRSARPGKPYADPARMPDYDSSFAEALGKAGVVVGVAGLEAQERPPQDLLYRPPIVQSDASVALDERVPSYPGVLRNVDVIDRSVSRQGSINRIDEDDGVVRRLPTLLRIADQLIPSLPLELLRVASGDPILRVQLDRSRIHAVRVGPWRIPTDVQGQWWIHYSRGPFPIASAVAVMNGTIEPETLRDHIVLIGTAASGLGDRIVTPVGDRPGVVAHAEAIENVLHDQMLQRPPLARWIEPALLGMLALVGILAVPALSPTKAMLCFVLATGVALAAGAFAFTQLGWLLDVATPAIGGALALGAMLMLSLGRVERQRERLRLALDDSREKQARLDGELDAARRIQRGMLPDPARVVGDDPRVNLAALMQPARTVGGDLFDFFRLDDAHLFFMVGDVSGKGLPASLFMALSKALIKGAALNVGHDPGLGLTAAGKVISRENPESMFISVAACILDLDSGDLAWCCAGHESPYRVRFKEKDTSRLDSRGGPALCMVEGFEYPSARMQLSPGDLICLVTDGITEAHNPAGALFGAERLSESLASVAREPSSRKIIGRVRKDIDRFAAGIEAADDLTILVLRWNGPRARRT